MRRSDEDAVRLARRPLVVGEAARAGQQRPVLVARFEWQAHRLPPPVGCVMLTGLTALANADLMAAHSIGAAERE
jgi:hypothetical protein